MYCYIFQQQIAAVNKNAECKSRRWTSTCPQRPPVTCNTACQSAHSIPQHDKTHTNLRILQYLHFFLVHTHTHLYTYLPAVDMCVHHINLFFDMQCFSHSFFLLVVVVLFIVVVFWFYTYIQYYTDSSAVSVHFNKKTKRKSERAHKKVCRNLCHIFFYKFYFLFFFNFRIQIF